MDEGRLEMKDRPFLGLKNHQPLGEDEERKKHKKEKADGWSGSCGIIKQN